MFESSHYRVLVTYNNHEANTVIALCEARNLASLSDIYNLNYTFIVFIRFKISINKL